MDAQTAVINAQGAAANTADARAAEAGPAPPACYLIVHSVSKKHNGVPFSPSRPFFPPPCPVQRSHPTLSSFLSDAYRPAFATYLPRRPAVGTLARSATAFGVEEVLLVGTFAQQWKETRLRPAKFVFCSFPWLPLRLLCVCAAAYAKRARTGNTWGVLCPPHRLASWSESVNCSCRSPRADPHSLLLPAGAEHAPPIPPYRRAQLQLLRLPRRL